MTTPSDSSEDTALPQEVFSHHIQVSRTSEERMFRVSARYHSSKFHFQLAQDLYRAEYANPEEAPDHIQELLRMQYPTIAQYLAYESRLNAASASPQSAENPSSANET